MTASARDTSPAAATGDAPTTPLLRVVDVAITHEGADVATPAHVSFAVAPGEVVLVLGPSGSGKSTLALALNGLIPHAVPAEIAGTVTVAGHQTTETTVAVLSTHVGMVFQDPDAQLVTGTVLDEVAFGVENLLLSETEVMRRVEDALRRVGLWERRAENPDRLSGGGRQRLAIACALAMGSPLLVLDEPTANLDPAGIDDVYAALADLVASGDRAIVLIEHNLDAALRFVDRVVVLDADGRLAFDGPARETLRAQAAKLQDMGVWMPTAAVAALRLRRAGYALDPLPVTPAELRAALEAAPAVDADQRTPGREPANSPTGIPAAAPSSASDGGAAHAPRASGAAARRGLKAASAPLIEVRDLSIAHQRRPVLHGVNLTVHPGDFLAVVGPNGAGKTTLVQAIAGVVPPPRGRVRVDDLDPGRADARRLTQRVGFVFQNPEHQFLAHTVFDELAHGLRLQRIPDPEVRSRVDAMLERFRLTSKADTHPFLLSGGQKRRLSVGTALIAGAPIIVLDEPTFGQDRARAAELLGLLDALHRDGTTVIVVTHDMQLVVEHATHTAVLRDGRLLRRGPTADVFADHDLLGSAGLRPPPLGATLADLPEHPALSGTVRLRDLPGGPA